MEQFPVRPSIYHPQLFLGLRVSDWPYILGISLASLAIPYFAGLKIGPVPLAVLTGAAGVVGSVSFFKWAQTGRRPRWLQLRLQALACPRVVGRRQGGQRRHKSYLRDETPAAATRQP